MLRTEEVALEELCDLITTKRGFVTLVHRYGDFISAGLDIPEAVYQLTCEINEEWLNGTD